MFLILRHGIDISRHHLKGIYVCMIGQDRKQTQSYMAEVICTLRETKENAPSTYSALQLEKGTNNPITLSYQGTHMTLRPWDPYTCAIAAAIRNRLIHFPIKPGTSVLALGCSLQSLSHLSDIVGANGRVIGVLDYSQPRRHSSQDFTRFIEDHPNVSVCETDIIQATFETYEQLLNLPKSSKYAFVMALHPRLGADSAVQVLAKAPSPKKLISRIFGFIAQRDTGPPIRCITLCHWPAGTKVDVIRGMLLTHVDIVQRWRKARVEETDVAVVSDRENVENPGGAAGRLGDFERQETQSPGVDCAGPLGMPSSSMVNMNAGDCTGSLLGGPLGTSSSDCRGSLLGGPLGMRTSSMITKSSVGETDTSRSSVSTMQSDISCPSGNGSMEGKKDARDWFPEVAEGSGNESEGNTNEENKPTVDFAEIKEEKDQNEKEGKDSKDSKDDKAGKDGTDATPLWVFVDLPIDDLVMCTPNHKLLEVVDEFKRHPTGLRTGLLAKEQLLLTPYFTGHAMLLLKYIAHRDGTMATSKKKIPVPSPVAEPPPGSKTVPLPTFASSFTSTSKAKQPTPKQPTTASSSTAPSPSTGPSNSKPTAPSGPAAPVVPSSQNQQFHMPPSGQKTVPKSRIKAQDRPLRVELDSDQPPGLGPPNSMVLAHGSSQSINDFKSGGVRSNIGTSMSQQRGGGNAQAKAKFQGVGPAPGLQNTQLSIPGRSHAHQVQVLGEGRPCSVDHYGGMGSIDGGQGMMNVGGCMGGDRHNWGQHPQVNSIPHMGPGHMPPPGLWGDTGFGQDPPLTIGIPGRQALPAYGSVGAGKGGGGCGQGSNKNSQGTPWRDRDIQVADQHNPHRIAMRNPNSAVSAAAKASAAAASAAAASAASPAPVDGIQQYLPISF